MKLSTTQELNLAHSVETEEREPVADFSLIKTRLQKAAKFTIQEIQRNNDRNSKPDNDTIKTKQ